MANTYTQIYLHIVFAVEGRQSLIAPEHNDELQKYITGIVIAQKHKLIAINNMPDHMHLLITVDGATTIERALQFIKGGFSYRLKKEYGYLGDVWQTGFSDVRVEDQQSFARHREYIAANPVKAGLAASEEAFPYCFVYLKNRKETGAKAQERLTPCGTAKAMP